MFLEVLRYSWRCLRICPKRDAVIEKEKLYRTDRANPPTPTTARINALVKLFLTLSQF